MSEHEHRVADALDGIRRALAALGNADAATPMGGLEAHGKVISDAIRAAGTAIADSLIAIAAAIDDERDA